MERKYWTLLAIAAAQGERISPVQLQKSLFLLGQACRDDLGDFYSFTPYNYGPFDSTIYLDAEELAVDGLVTIQESPRGRWSEYAATPAGLKTARELQDIVPGDVVDYLKRVVEWARGLSFQKLVRAIYKAFPEYQVKSVFHD